MLQKSYKLAQCLSICLSLLPLFNLSAQNELTGSLKVEGRDASYTFSVKDADGILRDLFGCQNGNKKPELWVFWDFGDGSFTTAESHKKVSHTFTKDGAVEVHAHFIVRYASCSVRARPLSFTVSKSRSTPPSVFSRFELLPIDKVGKFIRSRGEMVLIGRLPKAGTMSLEYNPTLMDISQIRGLRGNIPFNNANGTATVQADKAQQIFIYFKTKAFETTQSNANDKVRMTAKFENTTATLDLLKVDALDPNLLTVRERWLNYTKALKNDKLTLHYHLQFENEGNKSASVVRMEIRLPEGFVLPSDSIKNWDYRCGIFDNFEKKNCPLFYDSLKGAATGKPFMWADLSRQKEGIVNFSFNKVNLQAKEADAGKYERRGGLNFQLVKLPDQFVKNRRIKTDANIYFEKNPIPTPTSTKTRFRPSPIVGVRAAYHFPAQTGDKATYEVGLFVSAYRPDRVYFPVELSVAVNEREVTSVNQLTRLRPIRLSSQIRKNFGNFMAAGLGLGADFASKAVVTDKNNVTLFDKSFAYSNMQIFGDVGLFNVRNEGFGLGARAGFPFNPNAKLTIPQKANFQAYIQYRF
jgi:hypothetical protein